MRRYQVRCKPLHQTLTRIEMVVVRLFLDAVAADTAVLPLPVSKKRFNLHNALSSFSRQSIPIPLLASPFPAPAQPAISGTIGPAAVLLVLMPAFASCAIRLRERRAVWTDPLMSFALASSLRVGR